MIGNSVLSLCVQHVAAGGDCRVQPAVGRWLKRAASAVNLDFAPLCKISYLVVSDSA